MKKAFVRIFLGMIVLVLATEAPASARKERRQQIAVRENRKNCNDNLNAIYNALRNYADMHNGQLPERNNLGGLKEILQHGASLDDLACSSYKGEKYKGDDKRKKKKEPFREKNSSYIYFGGIELASARQSVPKIIIACDKFYDTKNNHFNILTADGKIEQIKLEKNEKKIVSTVDLIDYLSSKYKYPQDVYRALRIRAASIDSELSKAKKK